MLTRWTVPGGNILTCYISNDRDVASGLIFFVSSFIRDDYGEQRRRHLWRASPVLAVLTALVQEFVKVISEKDTRHGQRPKRNHQPRSGVCPMTRVEDKSRWEQRAVPS